MSTTFKKITDLNVATDVQLNDLFLLINIALPESEQLPFSTLTQKIEQKSPTLPDLIGRGSEGTGYTINRDSNNLVSSIVTTGLAGGLSKTWTFNRDSSDIVTSVVISLSDNSYHKTYTFIRNADGFVTSVSIS